MCNVPEDVREWIYERAHKCVQTTEELLGISTIDSTAARHVLAWLDSLPAQAGTAVPEPNLEFWGWWGEEDKEDSPEPYEHLTTVEVRPFANSIHFVEWCGINCERCRKSYDSPQKLAGDSCEIEEALVDGTITGTVSPDIAARMGYTPGAVLWRCPEFDSEKTTD